MTFLVQPCQYHFRAAAALSFPHGGAANLFRGALGILLRRLACHAGCPGARLCPSAPQCAYARCFEPRQFGVGPSGFDDLPRPFVLRAASLDGLHIPAGGSFVLPLHLFDLTPGIPALFGAAFRQLAWTGLGPGRPSVVLERITEAPVVTLPLAPASTAPGRLLLRFVTPTEIKCAGRILAEPRFDVIFARARDRVCQLRSLYQQPGSPLPIDFRALGDRSRHVRLLRSDVQPAGSSRRSTRTGQHHQLAGFIGEAEYEGEFSEFLPYLRAAAWSGCGRHTVWGLGAVEVVENKEESV